MTKRYYPYIVVLALLVVSAFALKLLRPVPVQAQAPAQYPLMDKVADKVVAKYQNSTCEQLWQKKSEKAPPTPEEIKAVQFLKSDPQMRTAFINRIAAPIANKMFDCGLIP